MKSFLARLPIVLALVLGGCSGASAGDDLRGDTPGGSGNGASSSGGNNAGGENDALFEAPSNAVVTPGSVFGLWGGATRDLSLSFDSRMKLSADTVSFATRCVRDDGAESAIVGVTVAARVDETEISVLESKKDEKTTGDITCRANARPGTTKRCEADTDEVFRRECFLVDGTELTLYGASSLDKVVMTKISD